MLYDILNGALTHWDRDIFTDDIFQMHLPSQKLQCFDNKVMFSSQSASSNYPALLQIKAWHRTGGKSISEPNTSNIYGLSLSDEYRTQFFQNQKRLLPWSCDILVRAILSDRFDNHWYPPPPHRQSIGIVQSPEHWYREFNPCHQWYRGKVSWMFWDEMCKYFVVIRVTWDV